MTYPSCLPTLSVPKYHQTNLTDSTTYQGSTTPVLITRQRWASGIGKCKVYFHTILLFFSIGAQSPGAILGAGIISLYLCLGSLALGLLGSSAPSSKLGKSHTNSIVRVVIFQMLVPLLILAQLPFLPETPRWYIQHGDRIEDARRSLQRVRDSEQEVEDEILAIREAIVFEKEVISGSYLALWKVRDPPILPQPLD
jgi:hypothetical protein